MLREIAFDAPRIFAILACTTRRAFQPRQRIPRKVENVDCGVSAIGFSLLSTPVASNQFLSSRARFSAQNDKANGWTKFLSPFVLYEQSL